MLRCGRDTLADEHLRCTSSTGLIVLRSIFISILAKRYWDSNTYLKKAPK